MALCSTSSQHHCQKNYTESMFKMEAATKHHIFSRMAHDFIQCGKAKRERLFGQNNWQHGVSVSPTRPDSSGFEHVFVGETRGRRTVIGFHNWIQLYLQEKLGHIDYKGYSVNANSPQVWCYVFLALTKMDQNGARIYFQHYCIRSIYGINIKLFFKYCFALHFYNIDPPLSLSTSNL